MRPTPRRRLVTVLNASFWLAIGIEVVLLLPDSLGAELHSMVLPKLLVILGFAQAQRLRQFAFMRRTD